MDEERPDAARDRDDTGAWALLLAIPMMLLCCEGPLLVGILGTGALAAFWAHGYGYLALALLVLAAAAVALWRWRRARAAACCPPMSEARRAVATAGAPAAESALVGRPAQKP